MGAKIPEGISYHRLVSVDSRRLIFRREKRLSANWGQIFRPGKQSAFD